MYNHYFDLFVAKNKLIELKESLRKTPNKQLPYKRRGRLQFISKEKHIVPFLYLANSYLKGGSLH